MFAVKTQINQNYSCWTIKYCAVLTCTVLDLGPCFGMNGHFRRDPDVILRLPESTIDFLSAFISFRSLSRVKMIVSDENIAFVWIFTEKLNYFRCFILIWGSFGVVLDIENQFSLIEKSNIYNILKNWFLIEKSIFWLEKSILRLKKREKYKKIKN